MCIRDSLFAGQFAHKGPLAHAGGIGLHHANGLVQPAAGDARAHRGIDVYKRQIGDWVSTPDVEGTVEDISLRSTKVRTQENALVIVPNLSLIHISIPAIVFTPWMTSPDSSLSTTAAPTTSL